MQDKDAYSIEEFCLRHGISRAHLYNEWTAGRGPRRMKAGSRILISREAAADYRRQCEADACQDEASQEPRAA